MTLEYSYFDDVGDLRGPFDGESMHGWFINGYFKEHTVVFVHTREQFAFASTIGKLIADNGRVDPFGIGARSLSRHPSQESVVIDDSDSPTGSTTAIDNAGEDERILKDLEVQLNQLNITTLPLTSGGYENSSQPTYSADQIERMIGPLFDQFVKGMHVPHIGVSPLIKTLLRKGCGLCQITRKKVNLQSYFNYLQHVASGRHIKQLKDIGMKFPVEDVEKFRDLLHITTSARITLEAPAPCHKELSKSNVEDVQTAASHATSSQSSIPSLLFTTSRRNNSLIISQLRQSVASQEQAQSTSPNGANLEVVKHLAERFKNLQLTSLPLTKNARNDVRLEIFPAEHFKKIFVKLRKDTNNSLFTCDKLSSPFFNEWLRRGCNICTTNMSCLNDYFQHVLCEKHLSHMANCRDGVLYEDLERFRDLLHATTNSRITVSRPVTQPSNAPASADRLQATASSSCQVVPNSSRQAPASASSHNPNQLAKPTLVVQPTQTATTSAKTMPTPKVEPPVAVVTAISSKSDPSKLTVTARDCKPHLPFTIGFEKDLATSRANEKIFTGIVVERILNRFTGLIEEGAKPDYRFTSLTKKYAIQLRSGCGLCAISQFSNCIDYYNHVVSEKHRLKACQHWFPNSEKSTFYGMFSPIKYKPAPVVNLSDQSSTRSSVSPESITTSKPADVQVKNMPKLVQPSRDVHVPSVVQRPPTSQPTSWVCPDLGTAAARNSGTAQSTVTSPIRQTQPQVNHSALVKPSPPVTNTVQPSRDTAVSYIPQSVTYATSSASSARTTGISQSSVTSPLITAQSQDIVNYQRNTRAMDAYRTMYLPFCIGYRKYECVPEFKPRTKLNHLQMLAENCSFQSSAATKAKLMRGCFLCNETFATIRGYVLHITSEQHERRAAYMDVAFRTYEFAEIEKVLESEKKKSACSLM